jgi:hypothetical protein
MLVPIAAAAFASPADGSAARATCVAAAFLAGFGLFPAIFAWSHKAAWVLGIAVVAVTCGGVALAVGAGGGTIDRGSAVAWVLISFLSLAGLVSPLLALGWRATAAVAWIGIATAACGAVYLAGSELASVPQPLLVFNPVVRILWHGLGFDWLRSANMYPRIGTVFYSYPERSEGILASLVAGGAGAVAALLVSIARRRPAAQR